MKNTGFSLVELLVVIAIMAILASVAVPIYSHYTNEAELKVDQNYLAEVYHAAEIEAAREGDQITKIEFEDDGKLTVTVNGEEITSSDADGEITGNIADKALAVAGTHTFKTTGKVWPATPADDNNAGGGEGGDEGGDEGGNG